MLSRGAVAVLLMGMTLPLFGCWPEQKQAMNACLAQHPYRGLHPARDTISTPVTRCMGDHGYRIDFDSMNCQTVAWPRRSAYCYAPQGSLARTGYRIEMLVRGAPPPPTLETH
jgi:hypothetical protein